MLLRASRGSSELTKRAHQTKEAILGRGISALRRAGQGIVRAVKDPLGATGRFVMEHPVGTLAGVGGLAAAGMGIGEGFRATKRTMEAPYPYQSAPGMYQSLIPRGGR